MRTRAASKNYWQTAAATAFFAVIVGSAWLMIGNNDLVGTIARAGVWAPFLLILLKVATIVISPLGGTPIYFAVPSLFGFWPAFFYLIIADTIGYSIVFWISRVCGRRAMNKMLSESQIIWADNMLKYIGNWKGLTLVRIVFAPFADTISYAAGLTKIPFKEYFWATMPLIVLHIVITNNVSSVFIKDQASYIIVVLIAVCLPAVLYIFRDGVKRMFARHKESILGTNGSKDDASPEQSKKRNLIGVFPGMMAPRSHIEPLAMYLRDNIESAYVVPIGLRLSLGDFDSLVSTALDQISHTIKAYAIERVILVGHSYGGRVAVAVKNKLDAMFPGIVSDVVMLGTPILKKPKGIPWHMGIFYSLSKAFRVWPEIDQPVDGSGKYICVYSKDDRTVDEESIKEGFTGDTIEVKGLGHGDLIDPKKIGPVLLEVFNSSSF